MAAVHHLAFLEFQNFNSKYDSEGQCGGVLLCGFCYGLRCLLVIFPVFRWPCVSRIILWSLLRCELLRVAVVPHASCVSVFGCRPRSVLSTRFAWDSTAPTALRSGACRPCTAASRCPRCRYAPSSRWRSNRKTRWLPPPPATTRPCRLPLTTTLPEFDLRNGCRRP